MASNEPRVLGVTMLSHALFHGYELAIPVFVVVWLDVFPVTEAVIGLVVGVGYAAIGVGAVPSGVLSDAFGSDRLLVLALGGMGLGFVLVSLSTNVIVLGFALVVWGAAASVHHPAGLSLLSRTETERGRAFAFHGAAGNVGTVLGPLAAAVLLSFVSWRTTAALLVLPAAAGVVLALLLLRDGVGDVDHPSDTEQNRSGLRVSSRRLFSGGFLVILSVVVLYGLYYRGILTFLPEILTAFAVFDVIRVFGRVVTPGEYVYAGLLAVGVVGQYAGGRLTDLVPSERALVAAFGLLVVVALAFVPAAQLGLLPLVIVCIAIGFAVYVTAPIYQVVIAERVTADIHGLTYGYTYLAMFGIGAIGATIAGAAIAYATIGTLFLVLAGLAGMAALISSVIGRG